MRNYTAGTMQNKPDMPMDTPDESRALHLNLRDLAREQRSQEGQLDMRELPRLASALVGEEGGSIQPCRVDWRVRGFMRNQPVGAAQAMVELRVSAELPMLCQRCLRQSMQLVQDTALFRLVESEPEITQEELEAEDEALYVRGAVEMHALVEDQMLLALPLVPMHAVCPQPIVASGLDPLPLEPSARVSPFAALARLKKGQ
jgi:uncharacterized protein